MNAHRNTPAVVALLSVLVLAAAGCVSRQPWTDVFGDGGGERTFTMSTKIKVVTVAVALLAVSGCTDRSQPNWPRAATADTSVSHTSTPSSTANTVAGEKLTDVVAAAGQVGLDCTHADGQPNASRTAGTRH